MAPRVDEDTKHLLYLFPMSCFTGTSVSSHHNFLPQLVSQVLVSMSSFLASFSLWKQLLAHFGKWCSGGMFPRVLPTGGEMPRVRVCQQDRASVMHCFRGMRDKHEEEAPVFSSSSSSRGLWKRLSPSPAASSGCVLEKSV